MIAHLNNDRYVTMNLFAFDIRSSVCVCLYIEKIVWNILPLNNVAWHIEQIFELLETPEPFAIALIHCRSIVSARKMNSPRGDWYH